MVGFIGIRLQLIAERALKKTEIEQWGSGVASTVSLRRNTVQGGVEHYTQSSEPTHLGMI